MNLFSKNSFQNSMNLLIFPSPFFSFIVIGFSFLHDNVPRLITKRKENIEMHKLFGFCENYLTFDSKKMIKNILFIRFKKGYIFSQEKKTFIYYENQTD